jgi:hypothetical protein
VTACIHKITWKRIKFDTRACVLWRPMFGRLVWHMADRWAPGCIGWLLENVKAGKCSATEARPYHLSIQDRPRLATARFGLRVTVIGSPSCRVFARSHHCYRSLSSGLGGFLSLFFRDNIDPGRVHEDKLRKLSEEVPSVASQRGMGLHERRGAFAFKIQGPETN